MGGEWQMDSLGECIEVKHGFAFKGEFIHDEPRGDVLLTPGNFAIGGGFKGDKFKYYDGSVPEEFVLREGDLLVTMTDLSKQADTLGYPAFVPGCEQGCRYLHNQRLGKVLIKSAASMAPRFLHYLLCSADYRHEVLASATGTTVKHTSPERIKRFRFLRPPLPEQRAIAHILGTLDDKIELNRRMNETLEAMARALFKSWFVDFDPIRTKCRGEPVCSPQFGQEPHSNHAPQSGKAHRPAPTKWPQHILDLFPDRFVESELGEIPEGWEVGCFGDVVEQIRDNENPPASQQTLFRHYSIPAFDDGQWPRTELGECIKSQKSRVPPGTILLSKLNPEIERVWLTDVGEGDKSVCSTEFLVLRPRTPFGQSFTYCFARSPKFRLEIQALVTGTSKSHQRARPAAVMTLPVVLPPRPLRELFERTATPLLERTLAGRRESRTLASLRDTLLQKLISGELRVPLTLAV